MSACRPTIERIVYFHVAVKSVPVGRNLELHFSLVDEDGTETPFGPPLLVAPDLVVSYGPLKQTYEAASGMSYFQPGVPADDESDPARGAHDPAH